MWTNPNNTYTPDFTSLGLSIQRQQTQAAPVSCSEREQREQREFLESWLHQSGRRIFINSCQLTTATQTEQQLPCWGTHNQSSGLSIWDIWSNCLFIKLLNKPNKITFRRIKGVSLFLCFTLLLHFIPKWKYVFFTSLHLFYSFSC